MKQKIIGFVGLSHLGLVTLASYAEKGYKVIGYDTNETMVSNLDAAILNIEEPELREVIQRYSANIEFTFKSEELKKCDLIYICKDIPTNESGESNLTTISVLLNEIMQMIKPEQILVILSQVPPGFTREVSKKHRLTFYQVETLIFGEAISRARHPERIIVGKNTQTFLPANLKEILESFNCPILCMEFESAELTKISINLYLINDLTLTNILSEAATQLGAKWEDIAGALRLDRRIGSYAYLRPGLGLSGGNLERDLRTMLKLFKSNKDLQILFQFFYKYSKKRKKLLVNEISKILKNENLRIAIIGLAYKTGTNSLKNAISISIYKKFKKNIVSLFDPRITDSEAFPQNLMAKDPTDCLKNCQILIVLNDNAQIDNLGEILGSSEIEYIFDPFGFVRIPTTFRVKYFGSDFRYH